MLFRFTPLLAVAVGVLLSVPFAARPAAAQPFAYSTFDYVGSPRVTAVGINDSGVVVGSVDFATDPTSKAYAYKDGVFDLFTVPDGAGGERRTYANGINDAGAIVGGYTISSSSQGGFVRDENGVLSILPLYTPTTINTNPLAINSSGVIVGVTSEVTTGVSAFAYTGGAYSLIYNHPNAIRTQFNSINDSGLIVGRWQDSSNLWHGYLYDNGVVTQYDVAGALQTHLFGINNHGDIVGYYNVPGGTRGFLLKNFADNVAGNEIFFDINFPGANASGSRAYALNDNGQIAGTYNGFARSFVAASAPEPGSLALMTGAGCVLAVALRTRRKAVKIAQREAIL